MTRGCSWSTALPRTSRITFGARKPTTSSPACPSPRSRRTCGEASSTQREELWRRTGRCSSSSTRPRCCRTCKASSPLSDAASLPSTYRPPFSSPARPPRLPGEPRRRHGKVRQRRHPTYSLRWPSERSSFCSQGGSAAARRQSSPGSVSRARRSKSLFKERARDTLVSLSLTDLPRQPAGPPHGAYSRSSLAPPPGRAGRDHARPGRSVRQVVVGKVREFASATQGPDAVNPGLDQPFHHRFSGMQAYLTPLIERRNHQRASVPKMLSFYLPLGLIRNQHSSSFVQTLQG